MTTPIHSLSISARLTLNMHSLNNEGGEGNQIQTRMVDIIAGEGRLYNVNAISGDMLKHIQSEHLQRIALGNKALPLCSRCALMDANRISADSDYIDTIKDKSDGEAVTLMLQTCTIDDLEGILITQDRSTPRKSVVEFGWVVGIPVDDAGRELTTTDSYFHVKFANERGEKARQADPKDDEAREANLGQRPFHRPASSGVYALVSHLEVSRIGYNDITCSYALTPEARLARHRALLESMLFTFLQLNGAMRSSQLPHLVNVEGVVTYATQVLPAPTISPLNAGYREQIKTIGDRLNQLRPKAIQIHPFEDLAQLTGLFQDLIQNTIPYALPEVG